MKTGKEPTKPSTIAKYIEDMGDPYWKFSKGKKVEAENKSYQPDLYGKIRPNTKKYWGDRVFEIEKNPTYSYYKSMVSLLVYVSENRGAKGFLCVPLKDKDKAEDLVKCFRELISTIKKGTGPKTAIGRISVYTFRDIQNDYRRFKEARGKKGPKPKAGFF